jgi:hypothetical protein
MKRPWNQSVFPIPRRGSKRRESDGRTVPRRLFLVLAITDRVESHSDDTFRKPARCSIGRSRRDERPSDRVGATRTIVATRSRSPQFYFFERDQVESDHSCVPLGSNSSRCHALLCVRGLFPSVGQLLLETRWGRAQLSFRESSPCESPGKDGLFEPQAGFWGSAGFQTAMQGQRFWGPSSRAAAASSSLVHTGCRPSTGVQIYIVGKDVESTASNVVSSKLVECFISP